ncbi:hypothetical protein HPP92_023315 [Vanilla planifolia]|uniref:Uncharacterized protein n=1 Tax=Vanilla planifolia TaxID=51239 RepID=A0A835PSJ7_VANPL|nr:hypothetical protein HPP92_023315 [Vanilla planifolia]
MSGPAPPFCKVVIPARPDRQRIAHTQIRSRPFLRNFLGLRRRRWSLSKFQHRLTGKGRDRDGEAANPGAGREEYSEPGKRERPIQTNGLQIAPSIKFVKSILKALSDHQATALLLQRDNVKDCTKEVLKP